MTPSTVNHSIPSRNELVFRTTEWTVADEGTVFSIPLTLGGIFWNERQSKWQQSENVELETIYVAL